MSFALLERNAPMATLRALISDVRTTGRGRICAVAGEAGAGKTSLLRAAAAESELPVWWGSCDPLSHPRPLGPLADIAGSVGGGLAEAVATGAGRSDLFELTLALLRERPAVVLIEDTHWADDSTVDLLTHLARRIDGTRACLVISYRDDEIGRGHPLRSTLSLVPSAARIHLDPLSASSVAALALGQDVDPVRLHAISGGNPFFVTELLAAPGVLPSSVTDAVLARLARLDQAAQRAVECCSIVSWPAPWWLIDALTEDPLGIDTAVEAGLLVERSGGLAFRHELARQAVLETLPPARMRRLHAIALERSMAEPTGSIAVGRLAYHAGEAGDPDRILDLAPLAAAEARRWGSMRVAAAHLGSAVAHADRLPPSEAAELWSAYGRGCYAVGRMDDALAAFDRAALLWSDLGDLGRHGEALVERNGPLVSLGRQREADATLTEALAELEQVGDAYGLAAGYARRTTMHMLAREFDDAAAWADRARRTSIAAGREDLIAYLHVQGGVARMMAGDPTGLPELRLGIDQARAEGRPDLVHLGYMQLGSGAGEIRRYDLAVPALEEGIAYDLDHEMTSDYLMAWLARCRLDLGEWDSAGALADAVLEEPRVTELGRFVALTVLGRLRARRGDPGVWSALDQARDLAVAIGHLQRLWPVAVARAEAAWIENRLVDEVAFLNETDTLARSLGYSRAIAELGSWVRRAGQSVEIPPTAPPEFAYELQGSWPDAVRHWRGLGCGFEADLAALESDSAGLALEAYTHLDQLGAAALLARAGARLRELGGQPPRRPNRATREQRAGLTVRESEVAAEIAAGLTNKEIAARLFLSTKTVEHHVKAVLEKLGVASRRDVAAKLGVAAPQGAGRSPM